MESYKKLARELITDHIEDVQWDATKSRKEILKALEDDTENVFGNLDGSRTCNAYEAQRFIDESGAIWDDEIISLYSDLGDNYFAETVTRGPEVFDVVTLELVAPQVIYEMLKEEA